jgi:hypothetical protein
VFAHRLTGLSHRPATHELVVVVRVLDLMMSVTEDRPPLEALGAAGSTVGAALSDAGLQASHPLFSAGTPWLLGGAGLNERTPHGLHRQTDLGDLRWTNGSSALALLGRM